MDKLIRLIEADSRGGTYRPLQYPESDFTITLHDGALYKLQYNRMMLGNIVRWWNMLIVGHNLQFILQHNNFGWRKACMVCINGSLYTQIYFSDYDDFIKQLAAGRKYHEHAGNVYIAATKWNLQQRGDCIVRFTE